MTEYEAYQLAAQYTELAHIIGEANHSRLQFWVGVSFTLLGITYLAPDRLTIPVTTVVMALYLSFTTYVVTENSYDYDTGGAAVRDAVLITENAELDVEVVLQKYRDQTDQDLDFWQASGMLFVPGLFGVVFFYVPFVAFRQRRSASSSTLDE